MGVGGKKKKHRRARQGTQPNEREPPADLGNHYGKRARRNKVGLWFGQGEGQQRAHKGKKKEAKKGQQGITPQPVTGPGRNNQRPANAHSPRKEKITNRKGTKGRYERQTHNSSKQQ